MARHAERASARTRIRKFLCFSFLFDHLNSHLFGIELITSQIDTVFKQVTGNLGLGQVFVEAALSG